jgi:hypothetical protein
MYDADELNVKYNINLYDPDVFNQLLSERNDKININDDFIIECEGNINSGVTYTTQSDIFTYTIGLLLKVENEFYVSGELTYYVIKSMGEFVAECKLQEYPLTFRKESTRNFFNEYFAEYLSNNSDIYRLLPYFLTDLSSKYEEMEYPYVSIRENSVMSLYDGINMYFRNECMYEVVDYFLEKFFTYYEEDELNDE